MGICRRDGFASDSVLRHPFPHPSGPSLAPAPSSSKQYIPLSPDPSPLSYPETSAMLPNSPHSEAALAVLQRLRQAGHQAWLAGGCVRDLLLGLAPKDYDVATSAPPSIVLDLFPRTFAVGAHFGVVLVAHESHGREIVTEVATFRSDSAYSDGRRPDSVQYTLSPQQDVQRRDFTVNGLLLDPLASAPSLPAAVLDYVGGLADLHAGILRAIGDPALRFAEDHLRLARAVRFAARFGFQIEPLTLAAIRAHAPSIRLVSRERLRDELTRMLTEGHARRAFQLLAETGLLPELLPEVARMIGVAQPPDFHPEGDVWTHTLLLLDQLPPGCPMTLAWAALLHDVGKPPTFTPPQHPSDRIRFNGHVEVGTRIAADIAARFRFSNDETALILSLVQNHMRFGDAPKMKDSTLKRFFRLPHFDQHLELHRMDCLASRGYLGYWEFVRDRFRSLPPEQVHPTPLLTGHHLIRAGYLPGQQFKAMLTTAEDAQLEGRITTTQEALALILQTFPLPQERP